MSKRVGAGFRLPAVCMLVLAAAALVYVIGCRPQAHKTQEDQPLSLDGDEAASLLGTLNDGAGSSPLASSRGPNARCHVCHMNYAKEKLAVTHARAKVSCEKCHGHCNEHCSDEDNVTPPTVLFARSKIVPACMACHTRKKLAKVEKHRPILAAKAPKKICTDCHGNHRLKVRTRRWDKLTGKLISDDGVRMIGQPKPGKK